MHETAASQNPEADAAAAIRAGDFRLFMAGGGRDPSALHTPPGVICFTPNGRPNGVAGDLSHSDAMDAELVRHLDDDRAYNVVIVESPTFPDRDICRPLRQGDPRSDRGIPLVDRPARAVTTPPHSLHEAARRGTEAEVKALLAKTPVNAPDGTGMTPLAWAAARHNLPAIATLLAAGADPWSGESLKGHGAVYWAVATGRADVFERFRHLPRPRGFETWPGAFVIAAVDSGNTTIVNAMLADGHGELHAYRFFYRGLPTADALEPLLRERVAGLSDKVLLRVLEGYDGPRLDLIRLALKHHANPNATHDYGETALGLASIGHFERSLEAVDLLLAAGADVNLASARWPINPKRPVWDAVDTLLITRDRERATRVLTIVRRLIAAGADLDLPNTEGKPPIWFLLTRFREDPDDLEDSPDLVAWLPILLQLGVDPNAKWQGRTIYPLVERKLGRSALLAETLRAAGAH